MKLANREADLKAAASAALNSKQVELTEEKARHAQAEFEATQVNKRLLESVDEARKQGAIDRATELADRALKKTFLLYWTTLLWFWDDGHIIETSSKSASEERLAFDFAH